MKRRAAPIAAPPPRYRIHKLSTAEGIVLERLSEVFSLALLGHFETAREGAEPRPELLDALRELLELGFALAVEFVAATTVAPARSPALPSFLRRLNEPCERVCDLLEQLEREQRAKNPAWRVGDDPVRDLYTPTMNAIALEHFGVGQTRGAAPDGSELVLWEQYEGAEIDRQLVAATLDQLDAAIMADPRLVLERRASKWMFNWWLPTTITPERAADHHAREQEWSLGERITMTGGSTMTDGLMGQTLRELLMPRQQRAFARFSESIASFFVPRKGPSGALQLEDVATSERYDVLGDVGVRATGRDDVIVGRIIPNANRQWLASGSCAVLADARGHDWIRASLAAFAKVSPVADRAVLTEMVTVTMMGLQPNFDLQPAGSAEEARKIVNAMHELVRVGLLAGADLAGGIGARKMGGAKARRPYPLMKAWVAELTEQAEG